AEAQGEQAAASGREGARYTLGAALLAVLKLLAPIMPHITDEIYRVGFAAADGAPSIHVSRWPTAEDAWASAEAERAGQAIVEVAEAVRRGKVERQLSVGAPLAGLGVACPAEGPGALQG